MLDEPLELGQGLAPAIMEKAVSNLVVLDEPLERLGGTWAGYWNPAEFQTLLCWMSLLNVAAAGF